MPDRYGILPRNAVDTKGKKDLGDVSAVVVQAGLHLESEIKGTAFTSGQGSHTMKRIV